MIEHADLPALNAVLNAGAAAAIGLGWRAIKRRRESVHKRWMLAAVALSACFLVSYLAYHFGGEAKHFPGTGLVKTLYLTLLLSHVVLAAAVVPLVLVTVFFALRDERPRHRRLARWTLPIWLYVSVTGVLVYLAVHVIDWP
jgi:putative membrane protein